MPQPTIPAGSVAPGQGSSSAAGERRHAGHPGRNRPRDRNRQHAALGQQRAAHYRAGSGRSRGGDQDPARGVDYVELPFTVKNGRALVAGLHARDIQVYENGLRQHISIFTADAAPLSVAIVIDQSMTLDDMTRVNDALGALQDAFTKYDEVCGVHLQQEHQGWSPTLPGRRARG